MRSRWEGLRAGLMHWIESREAVLVFDELRLRAAALEPYASPKEIVEALSHASDLRAKDRVLQVLVAAAGEGSTRRLAQALLLLCLWPGLDALFRRRIAFFRSEPQDLEAEIVERFTTSVQRIDLRRVNCLTATLIRNTERELVDARRREVAVAAKTFEVPPDFADASSTAVYAAPFGVPCGRWDASSIARLRGWLERTVGSDADLVVDAVIFDKSRRELAETRGISCVAARQRLGRALTRARRAFLSDDQSQTVVADRFC